MTYQEALNQEISSLPPALLPEVLDFVLFLKIKKTAPQNVLPEELQKKFFQQELQALSQAFQRRLAEAGERDLNADEVMRTLKETREKIAAHEYQQ
jgi:hypothetical protein